MRIRLLQWHVLLMLVPTAAAALAGDIPSIAASNHRYSDCDGVPIKRFGFCWVLGEAPDLLDDVPLQVDNAAHT